MKLNNFLPIFIFFYVYPTPIITKFLPVHVESTQINNTVRVEPNREDSRATLLREYLTSKRSPLADATNDFLQTSDKYGLDWTIIPAIAGVESGFEKAGNTSDYNPFGYMCKGRPCRFESFAEAIETIGKSIGTSRAYQKYRNTGSILELAKVYNYVSPEDWTSKIIKFQQQIKK